jgi:hypothetical protein
MVDKYSKEFFQKTGAIGNAKRRASMTDQEIQAQATKASQAAAVKRKAEAKYPSNAEKALDAKARKAAKLAGYRASKGKDGFTLVNEKHRKSHTNN